MGIHYTYGANKNAKLMEKKAKRVARHGSSKSNEEKTIPIDQVITLDHLTNPDKK